MNRDRRVSTSRRDRNRSRTLHALGFEALEDRLVLADGPPPPGGGSSVAAIGAAITFTVTSDWAAGFGATVAIKNIGTTTIEGWTLEFDFARNIDQIWNAGIVSRVGAHYVLKDAGYNASIAPGATVSFGFNGSPGNIGTLTPTNYILNGTPIGGVAPVPSLSIADASSTEGDPITSSGFLRTSGNQIVNAQNQPVRLSGVNWFGLETPNFAPHGLWTRGYKSMMDQMKQLGFNVIRLPYSNQLFDAGSIPNSIDFSKNPDLAGLNGLQLIDKIVDYAGTIGLRIILDHHRSTAGNSAQESGLWYTPAYPETRWINDWVMLANRYKGNPTVVGADLHNEPHGPASWGTGSTTTDWRLAAERAGNAVLAANPDWLIVVEGVETAKSGSTWWGGNLSSAGDFPVRLNTPGRLVYSPHEYPASVYNQSWFGAPDYPNNLPAIWDKNWGYLFRQGIAPLLIGEMGSKLATTSDVQWANKLVNYLKGDLDGNGSNDLATGQQGVSWTWWSWNPNSGDTGGILKDDWNAVNQNKLDLLAPVQFGLLGPGGSPRTLAFNLSLSQPTSATIAVNYATTNGTATAGGDYIATTGTLTFAPGETQKSILVPIIGDLTNEPDETLRVLLSNPIGATLADGDATGTILNDDGPAAPKLSITDATVLEGNSGTKPASFTVSLSAAPTAPITVAYATSSGTATSGSDFLATSGTLTFAPGQTTKSVVVQVVGDTVDEPDEQFVVNLSNPVGASIADGQGTGLIRDDDDPPPSLSIEGVSIVEGNSGRKSALFNVRLSRASAATVTTSFTTADGSAKAGQDYTTAAGTLSFAPGTVLKTIAVPILGDTLVEPNEAFVVRLSNAVNATLGTAQATGTILDDDAPDSAIAVTYTVRDDWGAGFVADVTIKNNGTTALQNWIIEFDLAANLTSVWNAELVRRVGNRYTIKAAPWNATIVPGASVTFGFQGNPGNVSRVLGNVTVNGKPV